MSTFIKLENGKKINTAFIKETYQRQGDWYVLPTYEDYSSRDREAYVVHESELLKLSNGTIIPALSAYYLVYGHEANEVESWVTKQPVIAWSIDGDYVKPVVIDDYDNTHIREDGFAVLEPDGHVRTNYDLYDNIDDWKTYKARMHAESVESVR
jgi:hypothetical protein